MNLDELKTSMSTLDDVLAQKSKGPIQFNSDTCRSAQGRIEKLYRRNILMCGVLAIVFILTGMGGVNEEVFPKSLKLFLGIFLGIAALWYTMLYSRTKKINVIADTPMQTMKKVAGLRLFALIGEIVGMTVTTVFFTLLITHLWSVAHYKVWLIVGALVAAVIFTIIRLRQNIRDFNNLTAVD